MRDKALDSRKCTGPGVSTLEGERPEPLRSVQAAAETPLEVPAAGRRPARSLPLTDDRSWDVQDVAYFLHVSESTVRNLERDRQLPALPRIGTRVTFDPKVVRAFRDGWRPSPAGRASAGPPKISSQPALDRRGR